MNENIDELML